MAITLDMEKACSRVDWKSIQSSLLTFSFLKWTNLIMECITTTSLCSNK